MSTEVFELSDGVHEGVAFDDYLSIEAMNHSTLSQLRFSPRHLKEATFAESPATLVGSVCHTALFEPERLEQDYAETPYLPGHKNSNAYKLLKKEWDEKVKGDRVEVPSESYQFALRVRDELWSKPSEARELLENATKREITIVWRDAKTGLLCKARIDLYTLLNEWSVVGDLKTSRHASNDRRRIQSAAIDYAWPTQAAFYMQGLDATAGVHPRRFCNIVIPTSGPILPYVWWAPTDMLHVADATCDAWMQRLSSCIKTEVWPGYAEDSSTLVYDDWALERVAQWGGWGGDE